MDNATHISFNAADRSYFALLKKEIHNLALGAGFSNNKCGEVDIVVAEMASNLIKHGGGGEILVRVSREDDNAIVELICIDNGVGMADPHKMVEDGMSTANTLGHGLGAIKRLSHVFQIYSLKDWGTIVLSRIYKDEPLPFVKRPVADIRSIVVAKPGETLSGDGAYHSIDNERVLIFLGDGLGHGPEANAAVQKAIAAVQACPERTATEVLRFVHTEVKKTRGLVGTIAIFDLKEKKWRVCGIGNIATRMMNMYVPKNHMSYNGIIGMNIPNTLKEQEIENERGQVIVMCSDGIRTRWELQKYTGIFRYDLTMLAAVIYKDFARRTDDMSVLVGRINTTL